MLKLIGLVAVVYVGWVTGFIQAMLLVLVGLLTVLAGA
jgi:hypothetical protein